MRRIFVTFISIVAVFAVVGTAWAEDPPSAGQSVIPVESFEGAYPSYLSVGRFFPGATAYWGRITQRHVGGSYGLWIAGSTPSAFPLYPAGTSSEATLSVPELADFYSSTASFYYSMPSYSAKDSNAFLTAWWDTNQSVFNRDTRFGFPLTAVGAFSYRSYALSSPSNEINLSRKPAAMVFRWVPGLGDGASGEGATIDDVAITGFKLGPVRSVAATVATNGTISLTWAKPAASTATSADDTRTIAYRVWRATGTGPAYVWSERTGPRLASPGFSEVVPNDATVYTYAIQAWEPGSGTGYGQYVTTTAVAPGFPYAALGLTVSADRATVVQGENATFTYVVRNAGDAALKDIVLTYPGGSKTASTLAVGAQVTFTASVPVQTSLHSASVSAKHAATNATVGPQAGSVTLSVLTPRISGSSRTYTAVELSKRGFPSGASTVVIATGWGFPDALSAASLAGAAHGPLLLVRADAVPGEVLAEISRLGATRAYVIGGESVVQPAVVAALSSAGLTVERVAGASRYETAQKVASKTAALAGARKTVFLATGLNFPDALAASSLSAALKAPILLTRPDALPTETQAALSALNPTTVVICGGTGVVSSQVEAQVAAALPSAAVIRRGGATRYDTAKQVIEWGRDSSGLAPGGIDGMYLASGTNFPDALAGGVLATLYPNAGWRPLMLTNPLVLAPEVTTLIQQNAGMGWVIAVGGTSALPEATYRSALNALP